MNRDLRVLKSVLMVVLLIGLLFGALALLPVLAQSPRPGRAAPNEYMGPEPGDVFILAPSTTGYTIDDGEAGFSPPPPYPNGNWQPFPTGGYKGDSLYTAADSSGDVATWRPDLPAGVYQVQLHWRADSDPGTQRDDALYTVYYSGGSASKRINQQDLADQITPAPGGADSGWYTFGYYPFASGTSGYVTLSDVTTTWGSGTNVTADAARFLPVHAWVDDGYTPSGTNDGHVWGVDAFDNIRSGILAVADNGTVHVGPGEYTQSITVTKAITLTGAGPSTLITVTTGPAIAILSSGVTISGCKVAAGRILSGMSAGIANYDPAAAWITDLTGYRIMNNTITGFASGVRMNSAAGQISNNTVISNSGTGIWVYGLPTGTAAEPSIISSNTLSANGGTGGDDADIRIEDTFTGTVVTKNNITGSGRTDEAGILVLNGAGNATLSVNQIRGCTYGVWILQNAAFDMQKVSLQVNTITSGTVGVRVEWQSGSGAEHQVIIGGSRDNGNNIYGNSSYEVQVPNYPAPITATYNYWGVCTLREIESEIYHYADTNPPDSDVALVTYEPAVCVPANIDVVAVPAARPADGISTSVVTATVLDVNRVPVRTGTMVGITTTAGSVPYGYVEAEALTSVAGTWSSVADSRASGGTYLSSVDAAASISWTFTGPVVSVVYLKDPAGGSADVYLDGGISPVKTINMLSDYATREWLVEEIILTGSLGQHTIVVKPVSAGPIWIDAFRSGGLTDPWGRVVTTLTANATPAVATVWATAYNGRIITGTSITQYPFITDTTTVTYGAADLGVIKTALPPVTIYPGQDVTFTIAYSNSTTSDTATNAFVTDTLPSGFLYVRSSSNPNHEAPAAVAGNKYVWSLGNLASGASGLITIVARADTSVSWTAPTAVDNVVEVGSSTYESSGGNNSDMETVTVMPAEPATVSVIADPTVIPADEFSTSLITATVRDRNGNLVADGTLVTFTTSLSGTVFLPGEVTPQSVTTSAGLAVTSLRAGAKTGTTTVTAAAGAVRGSVQVQFTALEPWNVTISPNPSWIRVSRRGNVTTTLLITVTDRNDNLVDGARVALTTTAGSFAATGFTTLTVTTTQGIAMTGLASACTVETATVTAAITTETRPVATTSVFFQAGLPYTITSSVSPSLVRTCGDEAVVTATIQDECGNPVEDGTEVTFNVVQGERGEMYPRFTTTVGGVTTSTLRTKGYLFGDRYLDVFILSRRETREFTWYQRVNLVEGLPGSIALTASPARTEVHGTEPYVRAQVRDCGGNNVVDGTVVTFAVSGLGTITPTVTTTEGGLAEAIFQPGCVVGTAVVTATSGTGSMTTTIQIDSGPPDRISVRITPDTIRNCGGTAVIEATLYDRCNNLVKDGTLVEFSPQYRYVRTTPVLGLTRRGVVTATVTSINKLMEAWPLVREQIAVTSMSARPGFVDLWIQPGRTDHVALEATPESIPINGSANDYNITIVARAADCSDTPVEDGTRVRLQTTHGYFRESSGRVYNGSSVGGLVTATLTSQERAGFVTVTGTADSVTGTTTVRFVPEEPFYVEVSAIPATILADGRSTSRIVARMKDEFENPVMDGVTVTFITDYGHFAVSNGVYFTTTTDIDGFAFGTLVAGTTPQTALIRVIAYNGRQGYTFVFFAKPYYLFLPVIHRDRLP